MRSYAANRFCLDLGQEMVGWLLSAEGGFASTEPVVERHAGGYPAHKHAGNVKVEDITLTCGTAMSEPFYKWLKSSIDYQYERKEGSIVTCNFDFKEVLRQDFHQALITEVGLPGVDAASKDACKLTVKMAPEYTEIKHSSNAAPYQQRPSGDMNQKRWTAAKFRLTIDGMSTRKVSKVEAINIKQNVIENAIGERLIYDKEPAQIDFPNLVFSIAESEAEPFYKLYDEFVCKGNSTKANEKHGQLEYLATDLDVLFAVEFFNLGLIKFTPDKLEATSEKIRTVRIEMYCERMKFDYKPASVGKPTAMARMAGGGSIPGLG